jgi:hypothetical protein
MSTKRQDRVQASQRAVANLPQRAARRAVGKARAEGRTFPTSGQRARAKARSR